MHPAKTTPRKTTKMPTRRAAAPTSLAAANKVH
jgi:hypothetical protein